MRTIRCWGGVFLAALSLAGAAAAAPITVHNTGVDGSDVLVASGAQEATIYFLGGAWDLAAPLLVVEEAGGRYTDAEGRYDWTTGSAIFSNGVLHDALLPLTRTSTTPPGIDTPRQS